MSKLTFTLLSCLCLSGISRILPSSDNNDLFEDEFFTLNSKYRNHGDISIKYELVDRKFYPIDEALYATRDLSPSKIVYQIPFKQPTSVLISMKNQGFNSFNITRIDAFLHAFHSITFYVQNYTSRFLNVLLPAKSELTLEYQFEPHYDLSLVDYVFSSDITYNLLKNIEVIDEINDENFENENEYPDIPEIIYNYKYVNVTISVYDPSSFIDFELIFMSILIFLFWVGVAYLIYIFYYVPKQQAKGKQVLTATELLQAGLGKLSTNEQTEQNDNNNNNNKRNKSNQDEWLKGTGHSGALKNRSNKKKNKKKQKRKN